MFGFARCFGNYGGYGAFGAGRGMGSGMFIMGIFFLIVIAILVYLVVKHIKKDANTSKNIINDGVNNEALNILNIKLANGEISEEDYLKRKEALLK